MSEPPLIGILGGMGPAATAAFYARLVELTPARQDQDHLRVAIWADPTVPDRPAALTGEGKSVLPWLNRGLTALGRCGVEFVVSPCNTAHVWLGDVARDHGIKLLSIIDSTVDEAAASTRPDTNIGILATHATLTSGLYQESLSARGLRPLAPAAEVQELVARAIYLVKGGSAGGLDEAASLIGRVCEHLVAGGAGAIVSGCTEISLVLGQLRAGVAIIDSTDALARAVIRRSFDRPGAAAVWEST